MIKLSHVYKTYPGPVHALRNIDLTIDTGEFVFLTGPSGAGKTTLFKMLCAYDHVSSGEVEVAGQKLNQLTPNDVALFRRKIGVVFQDFKLLKNRTLFENAALPLVVRGDRSYQITRRVNEVLEQVGLSHKAHQMPEFVSGGEQQRTAIARAIVHQPHVLIADEPTGNLDPELSEEIMELLSRVSAQGTTVFVASHNKDLVIKSKKRHIHLCDGILKNGVVERETLTLKRSK